MEGFFGRLPRPDEPEPEPEGCGLENENSMLGWDWQRSAQYGHQSTNLGDWLAGLRERGQPKITTWTGGKICRSCDNFDIRNATHAAQTQFSERYALWNKKTAVKDLKAAAEKGCKRCAVLGQVLHMLGSQGDEEEVMLKFLPASVAIFTSLPPAYLEIFPSDGEPSTACGFPSSTKSGRKRFADAMDPTCFEEVTMAINECIFNHRECRPAPNPARPNRLVEIPSEDGQPIKIVKAPADVEYAALSHCWGTEPLKRLLKKDGEGEVEFGWDELPPSFRDACTVTRALFLQYVWIDSLCIVQDDGADWEREAAKMGVIYEAAYVTISATDAAASAHGFLFPRFTESHFTAADDNDRHFRFTARRYNLDRYNEKFPHYGDTPDHPWLLRANDMDTKYLNPLQLRGWCFQERLMSKRVLHFKRYEVVLECNAGHRCECTGMKTLSSRGIKSLVSLMMQESLTDAERFKVEKLRDLVYSDRGKSGQATKEKLAIRADARLMQAWEMLVEVYTRTAFTHRDDVLPALGSLARIFQAMRPNWTYVGGLWLEQFRRSLMWVPVSPRGGDGIVAVRTNAQKPNLGKLAPSFTWAALSGRIRYMAGEYAGTQEFDVVSASTTPAGTDPYGDVALGQIVLRGRAVAFRFWMGREGDQEEPPILQVSHDDWGDPECSRSHQEVEICRDITAESWEWTSTNKVESGMETLERVKGFDSSDEYSQYFDDGLAQPDEQSGLTDEQLEHIRDRRGPQIIKEPLIMFRLTSGCQHGMRGVGAAALMLRKSGDNPVTYRRVGLRVLKDQVFSHSPEMDICIE